MRIPSIDPHGDQAGVRGRQRLSCEVVAGIFEPHLVAGRDHRPGGQSERALVASGHEHLPRLTEYAAGNGEIGRDLLPQLPVSGRVRMGHAGRRQSTRLAGDEPRPQLSRERIERRQPQAEGALRNLRRITA
jgi:hypothetical protein